MRKAAKGPSALLCSVVLCLALPAISAHAQTLQHFSHIVIIFQENRTPDNLFGSGPSSTLCTGQDDFEPGVDIVNGGKNVHGDVICLTPHPLGIDPENPDHSHGGFTT